MSETIQCPKCNSDLTYPDNNLMICSQCFHEWNPEKKVEVVSIQDSGKILDANGVELQNGDTVMLIKDLPVKGASKSLKSGTKVKNIRLVSDGDHNISCKIEGFGAMGLKSVFVRKVQ